MHSRSLSTDLCPPRRALPASATLDGRRDPIAPAHPSDLEGARVPRRAAPIDLSQARAARSSSTPADDGAEDMPPHANEVRLVGRLTGEPQLRELPSGDVVLTFRIVVRRPPVPARRAGTRSPTVDTLDCAAWRRDVQRAVGRAAPGDLLEVHGALRRRFWRGPAGPASRSEVEVLRVTRLRP